MLIYYIRKIEGYLKRRLTLSEVEVARCNMEAGYSWKFTAEYLK